MPNSCSQRNRHVCTLHTPSAQPHTPAPLKLDGVLQPSIIHWVVIRSDLWQRYTPRTSRWHPSYHWRNKNSCMSSRGAAKLDTHGRFHSEMLEHFQAALVVQVCQHEERKHLEFLRCWQITCLTTPFLTRNIPGRKPTKRTTLNSQPWPSLPWQPLLEEHNYPFLSWESMPPKYQNSNVGNRTKQTSQSLQEWRRVLHAGLVLWRPTRKSQN